MSKLFILVCLFLVAPAQARVSTVILSPAPFQIFQRSSATSGAIWISGETMPETAITGVWGDSTLPALYSDTNGHFEALWPDLPVWQHSLILTINGTEYTVPSVGIGDVYIIAGQSNAVGFGQHEQMYISTLGFRAGMLSIEKGWQELADPTGRFKSVHGHGSEWPVLATYIQEYGVPVAFAPVAVSGTRISTWLPGTVRFSFITDILTATPARAILWQQGEFNRTTAAKTYSANLSAIADTLYNTYGVPTFAALLYDNENVNAGIEMSIRGSDAVRAGADLRNLVPNGIHYTTDENLRAEAWLWYQALQAAGYYP